MFLIECKYVTSKNLEHGTHSDVLLFSSLFSGDFWASASFSAFPFSSEFSFSKPLFGFSVFSSSEAASFSSSTLVNLSAMQNK